MEHNRTNKPQLKKKTPDVPTVRTKGEDIVCRNNVTESFRKDL